MQNSGKDFLKEKMKLKKDLDHPAGYLKCENETNVWLSYNHVR